MLKRRKRSHAVTVNVSPPSTNGGTGKTYQKEVLTNTSNSAIINSSRFERQQCALRDEYIDVLNQRYDSGTTLAKRVYDKVIPNGGAVENTTSSKAYQQGGKVYLDVNKDEIDPRGAGTTWFHEHGHYVDYMFGNKAKGSSNFGKALKKDAKAYEKKVKKEQNFKTIAEAREYIGKELVSQGDVTHFIQDMFGGYIKKRYPNTKWGHDATYWKSHYNDGMAVESYAHMFESSFSPEKRELMKKYFPTAWDEFNKMLEEIDKK